MHESETFVTRCAPMLIVPSQHQETSQSGVRPQMTERPGWRSGSSDREGNVINPIEVHDEMNAK